MESASHGPAQDGLRVCESLPVSDAPAHVRRAAEGVLARFGAAWSDVSVVARITAQQPPDAESWLVAVNSDVLLPGAVVHVGDGDWTATSSTLAFGSDDTKALCTVHVAESASVIV